MKALLSDLPSMLVPCLTYGVIIRGGGKVEVAQGGGGRTILLAFVLILKVNRFILDDWESTE